MTPRYTLVPSEFFSEQDAENILKEVVPLAEGEPLSFVQIPSHDAVLVYQGERPVVYEMILSLCKSGEYNKVVCCLRDGYLYLVIAQGDGLVLCNSFKAGDFTTLQYYVFLCLNRLQINPQVSVLYFYPSLPEGFDAALAGRFKSVEVLR